MSDKNSLKIKLNRRGQRLTRQRSLILEEVQRSHDHPRAADIYAKVKEKIPNISFGTVYRNLRALKENGLVRELNCDDRIARYDGNVTEHHHAVCIRCGHITDVELPLSDIQYLVRAAESEIGFKVNESRVEFYGFCSECSQPKPPHSERRNKRESDSHIY